MCRVLDVSVSGFYAWKHRPQCARKREDGELAARVEQAFVQHRHVYGSPRIHAELQAQGIHCGRKRIVRLMYHLHLSASRPTRRTVTTRSDPMATCAPNILQREFTASAPNTKWVTDVTFIRTQGGWLYVSAVLDLFSRTVVGWAMSANNDEQLVTQALHMALVRRKPQAGLLHHSDRGSTYTSDGYQHLLRAWDMQVSMSRIGNCYDNAVMERFFGTLKRECIGHLIFETHEQARYTIFEYVECFYNRVRRHSFLGYMSPATYESLKR